MPEKNRQIAERLNVLVEKLNDRGRERLVNIGDGYILGFLDGIAARESPHSGEESRQTAPTRT